MPGPWITDSDVRTALAATLAQDQSQFPGRWAGIIEQANVKAAGIIYRTLIGRGYTPDQIDQWDARQEYNRDLAIYWALVGGCGLGTYNDTFVEKFNRIKELDKVAITVGGVLVLPNPDTDPNDGIEGGGAVSGGQFNQTDWRINKDTVF